ncbi:MAG: undecaprenyl-diphosphate phosphatase [Chloroflexi bacterium]|nr:undecaprenyl-diphosphate phosphatase [Chloroflexota bacterium]
MNDVLVAALLGLIQGLTEFLPVSSTAHLVIAEKVFRLDPARFGLSFDIAVHLGTAFAVLLSFARTWVDLLLDVLRRHWRMPALLAVGIVPAAIAGTLLESTVEVQLRDIRVITATLVLGSLIFWLAERMATQRRPMGALRASDAFYMGLAQAVALLPGISRSGITISAGLGLGLTRADATRFSFLLATPVIAGVGAKALLDARRSAELLAQPELAIVGFVASFLSGLAAVAFLMRFLRTNSLNWFIPYRLALATVLAIAALFGAA